MGFWNYRGNPLTLSKKTGDLIRLGADIALPIAILYGVEWYSQIPIGNMIRFQPDLGLALTIGTGFSITTGILKALK